MQANRETAVRLFSGDAAVTLADSAAIRLEAILGLLCRSAGSMDNWGCTSHAARSGRCRAPGRDGPFSTGPTRTAVAHFISGRGPMTGIFAFLLIAFLMAVTVGVGDCRVTAPFTGLSPMGQRYSYLNCPMTTNVPTLDFIYLIINNVVGCKI